MNGTATTSAGGKAFLIFVGFLVVIVAGLGIVGNMFAPDMTQATDTSIKMVNPCGWPWCQNRDANYAKINKDNSIANKNDGDRILSEAEAAALLKQAETERQRQQADYANSPAGAADRVSWMGGCCVSALLLVGLVIYVVTRH